MPTTFTIRRRQSRMIGLVCGWILTTLLQIPSIHAFTAPSFGLGALFLRNGFKTTPSAGDDPQLLEAAEFFTDAFWTNKVGGGAKTLSDKQRRSLEASQKMEFRRRYGRKYSSSSSAKPAELVVCVSGKQDIAGVAGVEVERIPASSLQSTATRTTAPLMSNVAVSKKFRRRGIAELLVQAIEDMCLKEWGYDECYLYVEKRNVPAVRLYQKLGYKKVWEDATATTLLPTDRGAMINAPTTLVCMRKRLGRGLLGRLLPF